MAGLRRSGSGESHRRLSSLAVLQCQGVCWPLMLPPPERALRQRDQRNRQHTFIFSRLVRMLTAPLTTRLSDNSSSAPSLMAAGSR